MELCMSEIPIGEMGAHMRIYQRERPSAHSPYIHIKEEMNTISCNQEMSTNIETQRTEWAMPDVSSDRKIHKKGGPERIRAKTDILKHLPVEHKVLHYNSYKNRSGLVAEKYVAMINGGMVSSYPKWLLTPNNISEFVLKIYENDHFSALKEFAVIKQINQKLKSRAFIQGVDFKETEIGGVTISELLLEYAGKTLYSHKETQMKKLEVNRRCRGENINIPNLSEKYLNCIMDIFEQLLEALGELEREGLLHGDIKPQNLCMQNIENENKLRIVDLGSVQNTKNFSTKGMEYTPWFAPYETTHKLIKEIIPSKIDSYCVARTIFFLLFWYSKRELELMKSRKEFFIYQKERLTCPELTATPTGHKFGHILINMLHPDPNKRFTCSQALIAWNSNSFMPNN